MVILFVLPLVVQCHQCTEKYVNKTMYLVEDRSALKNMYIDPSDYYGENFDRYRVVNSDEEVVQNVTILCSHFNELTDGNVENRNIPDIIDYPSQTYDYDQVLIFEESNISTLPTWAFSKFPGICKLYLSNISVRLIFPDAFKDLTKLRELHLDHNKLTSVSKGVYDSLQELKILDLSNNSIRSIEDFAFLGLDNVEELFLGGNQLGEVDVHMFQGLKKLEILDLSNNRIGTIGDHSFVGFEILTELLLNGNRLEKIDDNFQNLNGLEILDLSHNRIGTIGSSAFVNLNKLKKLFLNRNQLSRVDMQTLSTVESLKILNLSENLIGNFCISDVTIGRLNMSSNKLQNIDFYKFPKCASADFSQNNISSINNLDHAKISDLNLSGNDLTCINGTVGTVTTISFSRNKIESVSLSFNNSKDVRTINFSSNQISFLEDDIFADVLFLEFLDLSNNNLSTIQRVLFEDLTTLLLLNLSRNHIERFQFGTFNNLKWLRTLDVSHNFLLELDQYVFIPLSSLRFLYLESNQIGFLAIKNLTSYFSLLTISIADNGIWSCQDLVAFSHSFKRQGGTILRGRRLDVENFDGIECSSHISEFDSVSVKSQKNSLGQISLKVNASLDDSGFVKFFNSSYKMTNFFRYFDNFLKREISKEDDVTRDRYVSDDRLPVEDGISVGILIFQILMTVLLVAIVVIFVLFFKKFGRDLRQSTLAQDSFL